MGWLSSLVDPSGFPARWHCGEWSDLLGWTHITADLLTWASYTTIPLVLAYFLRRRRTPVPAVAWLFVAFILCCGLTHLLEAIIFWWPAYRLAGAMKVVTAVVSASTVFALARTTHILMSTPGFDDLVATLRQERNQARQDLEQANTALAEANAELARVNQALEAKVAQRTEQLASANRELSEEVEERRRKETELEASQSALIESQRIARLGSWRYTPATDSIRWSDVLYELLGREVGSALPGMNEHLFEDYTDEDARRLMDAVEKTMSSGEPYELELQVRPGKQRASYLIARGRAVKSEDGKLAYLEGTALDISEQRARAAELAEANARLEAAVADATRELRKTVADLEMANNDLENFVHMASHDMQAPLRSLRTYSQLLAQDLGGNMDNAVATDLKYIQEASARMKDMIAALGELSLTGRSELRMRPTEVESVIKGVLPDLQERIEELSAELHFEPLPTVRADPALLERVYANLLTNALKFGGAQPRIHFTAREADDAWVLGVKDEGEGVDETAAERMFLPFKRSRRHKKVPGTGMGLAIAKKAVERHHGSIWVVNEGGAHFKFRIPKG